MSKSENKNKELIVKEKKFLDVIKYNKIIKNQSKTNKILSKNKTSSSLYFVDDSNFDQKNENKENLAKHELTELHLAAKSGNVNEIKKLIKNGSKKEARDHYGRTPLYIAAEYGQTEAVKLLLEEKCEINVQNRDGQKALYWIIARCRKLAPDVLDEEGIFRELDEYLQIDKYYFKNIEPQPIPLLSVDEDLRIFPKVKSILEYVVEQNDLELISHPVITNFINFKWNEIRFWSFGKFIIDLIFCVVWNLWGVLKRYDIRHEYDLSNELALLILFIIGILTLIIMTFIGIKEFIDDFKYKKLINKARIDHIKTELELVDNDKSDKTIEFLKAEKKNILKELSTVRFFISYMKDKWNIIDIITIVFLFTALGTHLADIINHSEKIARDHIRVTSIAILFLSIRVFKNARVLWEPLGKVIMTLYYIIGDIFVWLLIFIIVWIPFTSSFYMLYGNGLTINCDPQSEQCLNGNKTILAEMGTYNQAMFFLYTVTLGFSDFDFEKYNEIDSEISELMVALYIGVTSLIMINILIALITSTFERISSSSKGLYLLEKAKEIILFEHGLCESSRVKLADRVPDKYYALYKPNVEKDDLGIKNLIKPISASVKDLNKKCSQFKMQTMILKNFNNLDLEKLEKKLDNIERYVSMLANQNNDNSKVDVLYFKKNKNSP